MSDTSTSVAVHLDRLTRCFGTVRALDEMSLEIAPGELVVLLGPSGCGKTTALRVLAGLEDADAGAVIVDGVDISSVGANKRDMGMVFQAYSLFPHMTARQNVAFGLKLRGKSSADCHRIAGQSLELVGLAEQADRYAHQMSGGQQQRVALARALAIQPKVLLLDEPLAALDAKVRVQLRDEIRRIQLEVGITTVFVTHDQEEALAVADRVAVMQSGQIRQIASPEMIYSQPSCEFVAEFVGVTNRLPGTASGGSAQVLGCAVPLLAGSAGDGQVTVLIRPEAVQVSADGAGIPAQVVSSSFLGAHGRLLLALSDGTEVAARVAADTLATVAVGDQVRVRIAPNPALAVGA